MNLLEIRQKFIELSGRDDLATAVDGVEAYTDNGADFYILAANRILDMSQENSAARTLYETTLAANTVDVQMRHCRAIDSIWYVNDDGERVRLVLKSLSEIYSLYPELDDTDSGTPEYYTSYPVVRPPQQRGLGKAVDYIGVKILPPPEANVTVIVLGLFHSLELLSNDDENYWSVNYPDILITATLRELEGFYRNTEGYKDFDNIVTKKELLIDSDLAEWTMTGSLEMEG